MTSPFSREHGTGIGLSQYANPSIDFGHDPSRNIAFSSENVHQPLLMLSPPAVSSNLSFRRRSSHSPQHLGPGFLRDRTRIRHNRPHVPRDQSHGQGDMLLAYATEQAQIHRPQSQSQSLPSATTMPPPGGPNVPQLYNMPTYNMSPPVTRLSHHGGYFGSTVAADAGNQETEFSMPSNEGEIQVFYPSERTSSHGAATSLPPPPSPTALYLSSQSPPSQQLLPSIGMTIQQFPPVQLTLESSPANIEVVRSRPKPQCWEHGCNGRQFSTFSNLLRHQREKSGHAMKALCPHCGTEFTRTTARNGHMFGGKCKGKLDDEASIPTQED